MSDQKLVSAINKANSKLVSLESKISKLQKQVDGLMRSGKQEFASIDRRLKALESKVIRLK